jgi:hypothetical protein
MGQAFNEGREVIAEALKTSFFVCPNCIKENPGPSVLRRKELLRLAEGASEWIMQHNIKPNELCLFRKMVEMLTDTGKFIS